MSRHLLRWPVLATTLSLLVLALASLCWGSYHALSKSADLERRVTEVKLLVQRVNPYVEPDSTYPPSALPVFALAIGPLLASPTLIRAVGLLLNALALAVIAHQLVRDRLSVWPRQWIWVFLLVLLACKPVRLTLGMGQFSLIPLACMLLALRAADRASPLTAGALTALALVKPTLSLPFLILLAFRGHLKAATVAVILHLASLALVSVWLGVDPLQLLHDWKLRAGSQSAAGLIDLPSVLARLWPPLARQSSTLITALALAVGSLILWRGRTRPWPECFAFACFLAAVFSYHRPYDLVLLFPAFLLVFDLAITARPHTTAKYLWAAASLLFSFILIVPAHRLVMPERVYEAIVIPTSYLLLALVGYRLLGSNSTSPRTMPNLTTLLCPAHQKSPAPIVMTEAGLMSQK